MERNILKFPHNKLTTGSYCKCFLNSNCSLYSLYLCVLLSKITLSQRNCHFINGTRIAPLLCRLCSLLLGRGQQSATNTTNGHEELLPSLSSGSDKHGRLWATSLPVFQLFHSPAFSQPLVATLSAAAGM